MQAGVGERGRGKGRRDSPQSVSSKDGTLNAHCKWVHFLEPVKACSSLNVHVCERFYSTVSYYSNWFWAVKMTSDLEAVSPGGQHQSRAVRRGSMPDAGPERRQPYSEPWAACCQEAWRCIWPPRSWAAELPKENGSAQVRQTLTQQCYYTMFLF